MCARDVQIELRKAAKESNQNQRQNSPRIIHYNSHEGCNNNFAYVMKSINLSFTAFNPSVLGNQGMSQKRADQIIRHGLVRQLCDSADVIVVSDTIPDARPILQSLVSSDPETRCTSKIVLEMTNRFDWYIRDAREYYRLMWEISRMPEKVYFVANNPLESRHLTDQTMATPRVRLLRPVGESAVPAQDVSWHNRSLAIVRLDKEEGIYKLMQEMGINVVRINGGFRGRYGGPKTLAKYRAFIEFPYQVSTMKLYENIAAGVVTLVPSPRLFKELVDKNLIYFGAWENILEPFDQLHLAGGKEWYKWMDYYSDEISPFLYYFDNLLELKRVLESPSELDTKEIRTKGPQQYFSIAQHSIQGWAELFDEMGFRNNRGVVGGMETPRVKIYREELQIPFKQPETVAEWDNLYEELEDWKKRRYRIFQAEREGDRKGGDNTESI